MSTERGLCEGKQANHSSAVVLHQCTNYIVIDKPFDLPINSDDPERLSVETLMNKDFFHLRDPKVKHGFRFQHRLDFATSGVLCICLNKKSAARLFKDFQDHKVIKHYIALVYGHVDNNKQIIDIGIGNDSKVTDVHRMCTINEEGCRDPRDAVTMMVVLEKGTYQELPATKVLLIPRTGRTHQLRVHCNHIGHRIVGDYTYSNRKDTDPYRMMLHAFRLKVRDLDIKSNDPFTPDLDELWQVSEVVQQYEETQNDVTSK